MKIEIYHIYFDKKKTYRDTDLHVARVMTYIYDGDRSDRPDMQWYSAHEASFQVFVYKDGYHYKPLRALRNDILKRFRGKLDRHGIEYQAVRGDLFNAINTALQSMSPLDPSFMNLKRNPRFLFDVEPVSVPTP